METLTLSSILVTLACVVILTGVVRAANWVWVRPKKLERCLRQQGIPGTPYKLLFGDVKEVSRMRAEAYAKPMSHFSNDYFPRIHPLLHQSIQKFGKECFIWLGPVPMVTITKPELIREVLTKIHEYQKLLFNPAGRKLVPGLVSYEGEKWAKQRKLINPAFHVEKLKLMMPAFFTSCTEMMDKWEEIVPETGSHEVDVWPYLTTLSADVISRAAFGSSYEEGQRIFQLLKEQTILTISMVQSVYIPGQRYVPTKKNKRFKEIEDQIQTLLKGIINKRKKAMQAGEATQDDLLGILMESSFSKETQRGMMRLQEVIDECKLFYFAGQETTSVLLVWTMILLSKHQDWQARAREEVLAAFGNNKPDFDGLNHLKTVTMILNEVLRLYPPIFQLTRRVDKDTKLGEMSLPAGAMVALPILLVQRDVLLWGEDAEEFNPKRFSEGISKATNGNIAFFPFSWGPRICIGEKFAIVEAKLALSMILQKFCFEISPSYTHAPMTVITLQPQHGAHLILKRV